jgi:RNA polymerase sigma-70 factor (ECF subfamily)
VDGSAAVDWPAELAAADRWMRTVILARTGERQAVDEVMQEIALAVVRQQATLAGVKRVGPWLYRLAVRQSLLYRRKMGRKRRLEQRFGEQRRPVESESRTRDPLKYLLAEERQQRVRDAMQRLGKRDAEILMLKYAENWTYQQIAEHLGASASAVESRLHRARAQLRGQLAALDVDAAETARAG